MNATGQAQAVLGSLASLHHSSAWATFTSARHKQTKLPRFLITGKIYSTSVREIVKEKPHILHLVHLHLFEAFRKKNNRGSVQCNLDLCNCKELGSKELRSY